MSDIRVAIVEDNHSVRRGLADIINISPGFSCEQTYATAEEAIKGIPVDPPDVVLMDINLPGQSGIECVRELVALVRKIQIIMLTIEDDSQRVFRSLEAGATGYLVKSVPPTELLEAIREVQRGGSPMSSQIARLLVQYFRQPKSAQSVDDTLTQRETEILSLISKGYRSKEVAAELNIGFHTVESHLRNIYTKLHVRSRAQAVAKFLNLS